MRDALGRRSGQQNAAHAFEAGPLGRTPSGRQFVPGLWRRDNGARLCSADRAPDFPPADESKASVKGVWKRVDGLLDEFWKQARMLAHASDLIMFELVVRKHNWRPANPLAEVVEGRRARRHFGPQRSVSSSRSCRRVAAAPLGFTGCLWRTGPVDGSVSHRCRSDRHLGDSGDRDHGARMRAPLRGRDGVGDLTRLGRRTRVVPPARGCVGRSRLWRSAGLGSARGTHKPREGVAGRWFVPRRPSRVLGGNLARLLELQFGCMRVGAIFVPLDWLLAPQELMEQRRQSEPVLLVHDADWTGTAAAAGRDFSRLQRSGPDTTWGRALAGATYLGARRCARSGRHTPSASQLSERRAHPRGVRCTKRIPLIQIARTTYRKDNPHECGSTPEPAGGSAPTTKEQPL